MTTDDKDILTRARERSDAIGEVERKLAEMQRDFAEGRDVVDANEDGDAAYDSVIADWRARIKRTYPERSDFEMRITEDAFYAGWTGAEFAARRRASAQSEHLDRLRTIVDEGIEMQPVLGFDELLTIVERTLYARRVEKQREAARLYSEEKAAGVAPGSGTACQRLAGHDAQTIAAMRQAADVLHKIAGASAARRRLSDERPLTWPMRKNLEAKRLEDEEVEAFALDAFEALVLALRAAGDPEATVHECGAGDITP